MNTIDKIDVTLKMSNKNKRYMVNINNDLIIHFGDKNKSYYVFDNDITKRKEHHKKNYVPWASMFYRKYFWEHWLLWSEYTLTAAIRKIENILRTKIVHNIPLN